MTSDFELLKNLTESDIGTWFNPAILAAARQLYYADNVSAPVRQGSILSADVLGNDGFYYEVVISATADGVQAGCDCGREYVCEHVGAVLLNWIHNPEDFARGAATLLTDLLDYAPELMAESAGEALIAPPHLGATLDAMLASQAEASTWIAQSSQLVKQELRELFGEQTIQQLRAIARRRGWKLRGTRKNALIDQLVQLYLDASDTADVVEALDDDHRRVLEYLALRASMAHVPESLARSAIRRLKGRRSEKETVAILRDLQELGLILAGKGYGGTTYVMPAAVVQHIPTWPELLAPFAGDPAKLDVRQSPAFALTQVAFRVWRYLRQSPEPKKARALPKPTQLEQQWPPLQGWLNPADELSELERMGSRFWSHAWQQDISVQFFPPALPDADLDTLHQRTAAAAEILDFAFNLLTSLGLVEWKYDAQIQINEEGMRTFLTYPDPEQLRILTQAWMRLNWWSEMTLVLRHGERLRLRRRLGSFDMTYNSLIQEFVQARMVVVTLLRRLSVGTWYRVADFRQFLRHLWPDYLHADATSPTQRWWLEIAGSNYKLSPGRAEDWEVGYAPFATACLEGPLVWLGVVRLGYDRQGLVAFQISDLGAYLLGFQGSYGQVEREPPGPALTVHGDGTVIARTGFATTGAYDVLNIAARLQETSAQAFRYRITAETAQHAFKQGWTGQAILDELETHSSEPIPEPLREQILAWAEGYGQVHLYDEVTLVEFTDNFALQELLASTSLAQHLVYQFSPRLIAIQAEAVDTLREEFIGQGHTPRVE